MAGFFELSNIAASYGTQQALTDLTVSLAQGKIHAIIGPNGAGKSTLLKLLAGLAMPQSGAIEVSGIALQLLSERERAVLISFVPQREGEMPDFSVRRFLQLSRFVRGEIPELIERERWIVREAGIEEFLDRPLSGLSAGELQRILLCGAIAQGAAALLLDEPTAFLDPAEELKVVKFLQRARQEFSLTIVFSSHHLNSAFTLADSVVLLNRGQLSRCGSAAEILASGALDVVYGCRFVCVGDAARGLVVAEELHR
jgi:ABC-type cobalamin/Fe3+-siderophores transport system ATPase subunit